jgi:glutaredoxin
MTKSTRIASYTLPLLLGAGLLATALSAGAQLYRWTDPSGRTHFTDTPPPASARNVQQRNAGSAASAGTTEPYAVQVVAGKFPVKLYSTPGCEACDLARKLLNVRGVPFAEVSVSDEAGIAELKSAVGSNSVPSLLVGRSVQKGFEEGAYHRLLDAAGYPKAGVLPARDQAAPSPPAPPQASAEPIEAADEEGLRPPGPYAPRR